MKVISFVNGHGELYSFNTFEEEEEIEEMRIPSMYGGVKVELISGRLENAFRGLYEKGVKKIRHLIIEDGIERIANGAFAGIDIEITTVHWPKSCKVIPHHCFERSRIRNVEGIEQVNKIESFAFSSMPLKKFSWPQNCKIIPHSCFAWSTIEAIIGIEDVEEIEYCAFYGTQLKRFSWPEKCKNIPAGCFWECCCLERIDGIEEVTDIGYGAFRSSAIKKFLWPEGVSTLEEAEFLIDCEKLEEINFLGNGVRTIDLKCFSLLKGSKKIKVSCCAINLLNANIAEYAKIKDRLILPYYVTEIN